MIITKLLPKVCALVGVWGVVALVVLYIDPATIKDVGIRGVYLPMLLLVAGASLYTSLVGGRSWIVALLTSALVGLGMLLLILKVFTMISGLAIVVSIIVMHYFVAKTPSTPR